MEQGWGGARGGSTRNSASGRPAAGRPAAGFRLAPGGLQRGLAGEEAPQPAAKGAAALAARGTAHSLWGCTRVGVGQCQGGQQLGAAGGTSCHAAGSSEWRL